MNIVMWLVAGGLFGWITYARFQMNEDRGLIVAALIGVGTAYFGGSVLAPMFGANPVPAGEFSLLALLAASVTAIASLTIAHMFHKRFGF